QESWARSRRPSGPTHRGCRTHAIRYVNRQCGYRNRQSCHREYHRSRREGDYRESYHLCHRHYGRRFGQMRLWKARSFREGQLQQQPWSCVTLTTSLKYCTASTRGPMLTSRSHASVRCTLKIYERTLVVACPILLPLARYCGRTTGDVSSPTCMP